MYLRACAVCRLLTILTLSSKPQIELSLGNIIIYVFNFRKSSLISLHCMLVGKKLSACCVPYTCKLNFPVNNYIDY